MPKKSHFTITHLSFEDFEKTLNTTDTATIFVDELVKNKETAEASARKKEAELKKAFQQKKRLTRGNQNK